MSTLLFLNKIRRLERFLKESPEPTEPPRECKNQSVWYSYKIDPITHELVYSIST
jgi:hypothetical protein